jgi:nucleoside-diphosphate-sugar epimerase
MRAAAAAGARVVHVSSLAVLADGASSRALAEDHPLEDPSDGRGPYVWGKLESERLARSLASQLGVPLRVVRPGALVDPRAFEPPGRLGKRLGNVFVAVGSRRERIGVADVRFAGRMVAWMARHFDRAPEVVNLLDPQLPSRGDLVDQLRRINPDLTVVWLPRVVLAPLSALALAAQRILRPRRPAINVAKAFTSPSYDTSRIASMAQVAEAEAVLSAASDVPTYIPA